VPESVREGALKWLSRAMFVVAAIAAFSLISQYGFYLSERESQLLSMVDLVIVGVFMLDALLRFALSRRKFTYLRARWPSLAFVGVILAQLTLVWILKDRGGLPHFLSTPGVFSLTKGYIVVIQVYLVFLILGEAVRANRSIASTKIAPARTVILSFVLVIVIGALLLSTPRASVTGRLNAVDSLFTATSAVCVTGLVVVDTGDYFTQLGHGIILTLIQIGGLGLITFATFFATVLRGGLGVRERLVLRGMMTFESIGRIGRTLRYVIGITFLMEAAGALLLYLTTRADFATGAQAARASVFHSISAFCNAGFSLNTTSFERYVSNLPVNVVMTSLIVIGGLGFPVLMSAMHKYPILGRTEGPGRRWPLHVQLVAVTTVALLVVGTITFLVLEWNGTLAGRPLGTKLLASYFGSVTARTAGFNTVDTGALALPTLFLVAALMFIGGSPAGTAGGVKTVTLGIVLASIRSMFRGTDRVELFKRRVPDWQVREALVVISMGIIVVAVGTLVLLMAEDLTLSQVLFEVVSAFGTVGLSTGVTPTLSVVGKLSLVLIMLAGRVGPLTLALALAQRRDKPLYDYPEERVIIG
jgi:trk system potassium uptake protein TrkH